MNFYFSTLPVYNDLYIIDVMNFLKDAKIAESCTYFYWQMPLGQTTIKNKGIACKRIDGGGYEIIEGYNGIF